MRLFINKDIRHFFWKIIFGMILFLMLGFVFSKVVIHDFKMQLLNHDYKLAGYMMEHGIKAAEISDVFADEKSEQQLSKGRELLEKLGYRKDMENSLLPDGNILLLKYELIFMCAAAVFTIVVLTGFFFYFRRWQKTVENAENTIDSFMAGDTYARIESEEEGKFSKLFDSINGMAASLNAHIDREKHGKDFLKDTISNISHQLKTPLTALKLYNEIIEEEYECGDTVRKFSKKTTSALERMEVLIGNLLKITKLDAGTITLDKRENNIKELMQELVLGFDIRTEKEYKTITLKGSNKEMLFCDADWIIEAVGNLVKNALDHTDAGDYITITWQETPVVVKITVEDNGKGIHEEDIHHIFKRFYRSKFSQDTEGVGLGLPLTKSIVEAHNGTITVNSTLGKGSTFTLDFLKLTKM